MPLSFYSTNRQAPEVSLREALLTGQAPDRGLYLPRHIPRFERGELAAMRKLPYPEIAFRVLRKYTTGIFDEQEQLAMCRRVYNYDIPLERVTGRRFVMRLDRGPTASFKDFAAAMMGQWMSALMRQEGGELVILTATSGDTGSAIANAFFQVDNIRVVVLFPPDEVSNRQRRQMTTLGGNITTIGINGQFDDCQALVKRAFSDPDLQSIRLTSANSINIGRLLPQIVYYVYAYVKLAEGDGSMLLAVPSGNFGDMMGAILGWRMGLPLRRLIVATNANDEVPQFLSSGQYEKIVPSRVCISNAMNVGHPSNFARVVDVYGGHMDETGFLHEEPDREAMRRDLWAVSIDDRETRAIIRSAWTQHKLLLEPHGAVGWAGLQRYLETEDDDDLTVAVETAHPAKFPEEIQALLGFDPEIPPSLAGLEDKPENFLSMDNNYGKFKDFLLEVF